MDRRTRKLSLSGRSKIAQKSRLLLDLTEKAAFVCAPQQYAAIVEGRAPEPLCGFLRADVFPLTAELKAQVTAGRPINWNALQHI
jgi:hypothetical protein